MAESSILRLLTALNICLQSLKLPTQLILLYLDRIHTFASVRITDTLIVLLSGTESLYQSIHVKQSQKEDYSHRQSST